MIEPAKAENKGLTRRRLLKKIGISGFSGVAVASGTTLVAQVTEDGVEEFSDSLASLFQTHYRRMSPEEVEATIARLQRKTKR
jgi:hypothetical protein